MPLTFAAQLARGLDDREHSCAAKGDARRGASKLRLPVGAHRSQMADDGALVSYSSILDDQMRRAAEMVDMVLRGKKPSDIPVEQSTKFELVVNKKAARALGITIPQSLLAQADRVIE